MDISCYKNVIGLTSKDCECYATDARPVDYNTSASGFYIDDLESIKDFRGLEDCGSEIWAELTRARDQAVASFMAHTNALIATQFKLTRPVYAGGVGEAKGRRTITHNRRYAGVRAAMATVRGGAMQIDGIGVLMDSDTSFPVFIYNNLNELLHTVQVTAVRNRHTVTPCNIRLPLYNKYANPLEYFIIYDRDLFAHPATPVDNSVDCGCGRWKPVWDCTNPYYNGLRKGGQAWANWGMFGAWEGDTLIDFDACGCRTSNKLNGLTLDVRLGCKIDEELCRGSLDFEGNPLALSTAMAIRNKAGENLLTKLLSNGKFNRYTVLNADELAEARAEYLDAYNEHVEYIVSSLNVEASDCLQCRSFMDMQSNGIFS